jgi:hypothetical protein
MIFFMWTSANRKLKSELIWMVVMFMVVPIHGRTAFLVAGQLRVLNFFLLTSVTPTNSLPIRILMNGSLPVKNFW